jgi:hypothetical protein
MNKLELIQALKDATDLTKPEAAAVVDIFSMEWPMPLPKVIGWKSEDCVLFSSRNMMDTPGAIQRPARR